VIPKVAGAASRTYYGELVEAGINVFQYNKGVLHAKVMIVTANPYWPEYDSVRCPRFARNRVLSEEIRGKVSTDEFPSACR
jgi:hypothetical protein